MDHLDGGALEGARRFSDLQRRLSGISPKGSRRRCADGGGGLCCPARFAPAVPLHVEYELTAVGQS